MEPLPPKDDKPAGDAQPEGTMLRFKRLTTRLFGLDQDTEEAPPKAGDDGKPRD